MPGAAADGVRLPPGLLVAASVAFAVAVATTAASAAVLPQVDGQGGIDASWRVAGLPRQSMPMTRFVAERIDGRDAVRLDADASYGNLVHDLPTGSAPRTLRWSWRLQQRNTAADLHGKAGDDAAVKVCLAFDMPIDDVPFVDRQLLRLARAGSAMPLPAATLCWVWGHRERRDEMIRNAHTARVRFIVLRNADDPTGRWLDESRDVAADFRRAFGDESRQVPPASALILSADADNTQVRSVAHVATLAIAP